MKRFNKFLALFLAVVMIVGLLPATVSAATDPNVIYKNDFESIAELSNSTSVLAYNTFYAWPYNQDSTGNLTDVYTDTDGNKCIKLNPVNQTTSWAGKTYGIGMIYIGLNPNLFTTNTEYKVSARVKADAANNNVVIDVYDTGANHYVNVSSGKQAVGTEWTAVEFTFTTPADQTNLGAVRIRIGYAGFYTDDANAYLMVDDFCVSKVPAYNYETMETELAAGEAKLQADVDGTGNDLVLKAGKTLDLAGYTLTVDSLSAMPGAKVTDSVGGGKIVVANDNLTLQADNGMMPIKTNEGYVLSNVKLTNNEVEDDGLDDIMVYETRPSLGAANNAAYLADGAADNGLSIIIRLTWTNASNGTTTTMDVPCSEELIKDIYGGTGAFRLLVKGVDGVENLKVATVITSTTGVTCVSVAQDYTAPAV